MRKEMIEIYQVDELSKEAQQKAIEWWRRSNEYEDLTEAMKEHLKELLKEYKIEGEAMIFYSLSCSQGDGAMFYGDFIWRKRDIEIQYAGIYCHSHTAIIEVETKSKIIKGRFVELYHEICAKLEKYGYDYIDHEDEEATCLENISLNEYEFTVDGKKY